MLQIDPCKPCSIELLLRNSASALDACARFAGSPAGSGDLASSHECLDVLALFPIFQVKWGEHGKESLNEGCAVCEFLVLR